MKPVLLLLLALLLKLPPGSSPKVRVTFSPLTKAAYLAAKKTAVETKPKMTFPLKKARGRIVIPTAKGSVVFKDSPVDEGSPDWEEYTYRGYSPQLECHLIEHSQNDLLIDIMLDKNGRQMETCGRPIYSPDLKNFATVSAGISFPPYSNSIRLYRLENHHWRQVWELEPSAEPMTWEPNEVQWLSPKVLILRKRMWNGNNKGKTFTYAKLTITP